jgi:hypothetical protein
MLREKPGRHDKPQNTVAKFAGLIASLSGADHATSEEFRAHVEVGKY